MGVRGPVPMRSDLLQRKRAADKMPDKIKTGLPRVPAPPPEASWCDLAKRMYLAAVHSAQAKYAEESDWAYLYFACDSLNEMILVPGKSGRSAMKLVAVVGMFGDLGFTEGDRRRMGIEIDRELGDAAADAEADAYISNLLN